MTSGGDVSEVGMTIREMIQEVRGDVKEIKKDFARHLDWSEEQRFEIQRKMVTKEELQIANSLKKTALRYLITTLIAMAGLIIAATSIILSVK